MLDIRLFRENPEIIKESERKRYKNPSLVDEVIKYDKQWRETLKEVEKLRKERNMFSREVAKAKKENNEEKAEEIIKKMDEINEKIKKLEKEAEWYLKKRDEIRYKIGNILHESVPIGEDEEHNLIERTWGKAKVYEKDLDAFLEQLKDKEKEVKMEYKLIDFKPKSHVDILEEKRLANLKKAAEVSGARFYYLLGDLVKLNISLIYFAMDFLEKKGFTPIWTPFAIKKDAMRGAAELADFEEQLYKIENEDLYLIATAEQTLANFHRNEVLFEKDLPKKYAGFSTNFRREAGAHGKDTKGIFRVHQFDKVEQYVYCLPEESWKIHEELIKNAEEIFQKLEIPYRVVNIASGEMNDNAAKKYDLEGWMPAQAKFRELVSCSNTTDYQARKLNIKVVRKDGRKEVLHTLNSTAIATERAMVAIIENHQTKEGKIKVPKVLRSFLGKKYLGEE